MQYLCKSSHPPVQGITTAFFSRNAIPILMTDFTPALQKVSHTLVHFEKKNGTGTEAPMPVHFPVSFCAVNPLTPDLSILRLLTTKRRVIIRAASGASAPYIPHNSILLQTTDAFLPSSPRSTANHQALHRLCYRTSQTVGTYRALKTAVASQCLSKK